MLGNNVSMCDAMEALMKDEIRGKIEPFMQAKLGGGVARIFCWQLEIQLVRLAFGKSMHPAYPGGVAGKFSPEKAKTLTTNFLVAIEKGHDSLADMVFTLGYATKEAEAMDVTKQTDRYHVWSAQVHCFHVWLASLPFV